MRVDAWWAPVLLITGATSTNTFIDLGDEDVRFDFGLVFDRTIKRDEIESAHRRAWQWWMGIGMRANLRGLIGLIGSQEGVVEVKLKHKQRAWGVIPCDRIAISLQDPDAFLAALHVPER